MKTYETSATVEGQGQVRVGGVPFAPGTQVEVIITPKTPTGPLSGDDADTQALAATRARMQHLFATVRGFRMAPKFRREDLYDRHGLR